LCEDVAGKTCPMNQKDLLLEKFKTHSAAVGVIGLGYVGLPLALAFAERGFRAIGLDIDPNKIEALRAGRCYIHHIGDAPVQRAVSSGRFVASADFSQLAQCDAIMICVPTPLTESRDPDLSYVDSTTRQIKQTLRP